MTSTPGNASPAARARPRSSGSRSDEERALVEPRCRRPRRTPARRARRQRHVGCASDEAIASGSRRPPPSRAQEHGAVRADEHRVVDVDRVRIARVVVGDDDLGAGRLEDLAERLVLGGRGGGVGGGAPAVLAPVLRVLGSGGRTSTRSRRPVIDCEPKPAIAGRYTAFGGVRPSSRTARSAETTSRPIASRVSRVALAMCGVRTTFSIASSSSLTAGSCSKTSSAAPAIVLLERCDERDLVDDGPARCSRAPRRLHRLESLASIR